MKWFKHDSNANTDAKLRKVRIKYGMEGYGLYWYCLELIAGTVEKHNITFELEHDSEVIAFDTGINAEIVQEMMAYMVNLDLFEVESNRIFCQKMATRTDEYTAKLLRNIASSPDNIRTISVPTPDKVPPIRREESREEEKRVEDRSKEKPKHSKKTAISKSFHVSERVKEWANKKGYSMLDEHLENFVLKSSANNYKYTDWDSAFMSAIRSDWANINTGTSESSSRIGAFPKL